MKAKINTIKITSATKALVVSDIHLRLPVSRELSIIEKSLAERINDLNKNKNAILVLNGDIFEMWAQTSQSPKEIIEGFQELTKAINAFNGKSGHRVVMTVGNHDEAINNNPAYKTQIEKLWKAEICDKLIIEFNGKTAMVEHGHEYDSYNKTGSGGGTHGRELVQKTLPKLQRTMPALFNGIEDVINRGYLPSYVMSRFAYNILAAAVFPITLVFSLTYFALTRDARILIAFGIVWLGVWLITLVLELVLRLVAYRTLGGGSQYMKNIIRYDHRHKFDYLVLGHTHQGEVSRNDGFTYANSGCNDKVAIAKIGWLCLFRFKNYVQLSGLEFDSVKKQPFKYHEELIALLK